MAQERKYEEALERAKKYHQQLLDEDNPEWASKIAEIFPELKKEDENELKWLTQFIQEEAYDLSMDIRDNEDRIKLKNLQKSLAWLEKQDKQNPTDKLKPLSVTTVVQRFKIGDWVIFNENCNSVYYVERIDNNRYYLRHYLGGTLSVHFDNELIRLWTIQDAKDGDVLADKYNNIGIFQKCEGICWHSYIYLGCNGELQGFSFGGSHEQINTHPATEKQRNALFKSMTDIGYTFDFKKKELEKIKQKPSQWNISDCRTWQYIVCDVLTKYNGIGQYLDDGFCKEIAKRMQENWSKKLLLEQNPT